MSLSQSDCIVVLVFERSEAIIITTDDNIIQGTEVLEQWRFIEPPS